MFELVLVYIQELANNVIANIFADYLTGNVKDSWRLRNAQQRTRVKLLESLEPLFDAELGRDQAVVLAQNLQRVMNNSRLTHAELAKHRYDLDSLTDSFLTRDSVDTEVRQQGLDGILRKMVHQVCFVTLHVADVLPEWERASWLANFHAFDELDKKLEEHSRLLHLSLNTLSRSKDQAFQRLLEMENRYRQALISSLNQIHLKGIGTVNESKNLQLDSVYTQVRLQKSTYSRKNEEPDKFLDGVAIQSTQSRVHYETRRPTTIARALSEAELVVIVGGPGSGKSTLAQFIALNAARNSLENLNLESPDLRVNRPFVPFLLKVRSFNFEQLPSPQEFISCCVRNLRFADSDQLMLDILTEKRALIIIDGLDECEIGSPSDQNQSERDKVIEWLTQLIELFPGNRVIVTSRVVGYSPGLLNGFAEYMIMPLSMVEQSRFISLWYRAVELSATPEDQHGATDRAETSAKDLTLRLKLEKSVQVLASNPLLLSVICVLHRFKGESLPERKIDLLSACVDTLLYDFRKAHQLKPSVIGDLDARQMRSLLEPLAWKMSIEGFEQVSEEYVESVFWEYLPEIEQPEERAREILDTIRDRTGVLVEVAPRTYAFSDLLFQEYFTAEEFAHIREFDLLIDKASDPRWKEIIPMAVAACKGNQSTLISGLLAKNAVTLAGSAMAKIERVPVSLRKNVVDSMNQIATQFHIDFSYDTVSSLVEIGTKESSEALIHILLKFPVVPPSEHLDALLKWERSLSTATNISELARNTVGRCLLFRSLDLDTIGLNGIYSIGYLNEGVTENRGASWDFLQVGVEQNGNTNVLHSEQAKRTNILSDPIYCYAVMLDVCSANRMQLKTRIWEAFETVVSNSNADQANRLLALHLTWYICNANDHVESLVNFLENFPRHVCPAFQVGLINNAMSRISETVTSSMKVKILSLWHECVSEVRSQIVGLIEPWQPRLGIEVEGVLSPSSFDKLNQEFYSEFNKCLSSRQPFDFDSVPDEDIYQDSFASSGTSFEQNIRQASNNKKPGNQKPFEVCRFSSFQIGTIAFFGMTNSELMRQIANKLLSQNSLIPGPIVESRMGEEVTVPPEPLSPYEPQSNQSLLWTFDEMVALDKAFAISLVTSRNSHNEQVYAYINVRGDRLGTLLNRQLQNTCFDLSDFATIVLTGFGEPTISDREKLKRDYLFGEHYVNMRIFPPLAEVT